VRKFISSLLVLLLLFQSGYSFSIEVLTPLEIQQQNELTALNNKIIEQTKLITLYQEALTSLRKIILSLETYSTNRSQLSGLSRSLTQEEKNLIASLQASLQENRASLDEQTRYLNQLVSDKELLEQEIENTKALVYSLNNDITRVEEELSFSKIFNWVVGILSLALGAFLGYTFL